MLSRSIPPKDNAPLKNRPFTQRLGFAVAGIRHVWNNEGSFGTQSLSGLAALLALALLRPAPIWWAVVLVVVALVLALEMMNAALEYLCDHLHPERHQTIKHVKDAAAGGVLIASLGALLIGILLTIASA